MRAKAREGLRQNGFGRKRKKICMDLKQENWILSIALSTHPKEVDEVATRRFKEYFFKTAVWIVGDGQRAQPI